MPPATSPYGAPTHTPGPAYRTPYRGTSGPGAPPEMDLAPADGSTYSHGADLGGAEALGTTCGMDAGIGCAQPRAVQWMLTADLLVLARTSSNSYPILRCVQCIPPHHLYQRHTVLDASDLDYGSSLGYRVSASRMVACGWGVEAAFLGIDDNWNHNGHFTGQYELNGHGFTIGAIPDPDPNNWIDVDFYVRGDSSLYSGEVNVTRNFCDWATLRAGMRWIRFKESLLVDELSVTPDLDLCANTENQMYGPQLGVDLKLLELWCRLRLNATINCAVLYNHATSKVTSYVVGPPLCNSANEVALAGELGLNLKYRVMDHVAVRCGFYTLALHNVALAPDQIRSSDVVSEISTTTLGSMMAYGGNVGVEIFW
jgi:hypothetical protein